MTHHLNLDTLTLAYGEHETRDEGVCLLEAVAWWAGEPHTSSPACVSAVLAHFGRDQDSAITLYQTMIAPKCAGLRSRLVGLRGVWRPFAD